jgi:hypothetical protein
MKIKYIVMSSAAVFLSASAAFAAYDPSAETREREITRNLNQEQLATARSDLDRYERSQSEMRPAPAAMPDPADDATRQHMDEMTSTMPPSPISPEGYEPNPGVTDRSNYEVGSVGNDIYDSSDNYSSADGSRSSRTDSGFMSDTRSTVTRQATEDEVDRGYYASSRASIEDTRIDDDVVNPGAGISLSEVVRPQATLPDVKVETSRGERVGEVQTVLLDSEGRPSILIIEADELLNDEPPIRLEASRFLYDPDRNVVVTDLSTTEIQNMAMAE